MLLNILITNKNARKARHFFEGTSEPFCYYILCFRLIIRRIYG